MSKSSGSNARASNLDLHLIRQETGASLTLTFWQGSNSKIIQVLRSEMFLRHYNPRANFCNFDRNWRG